MQAETVLTSLNFSSLAGIQQNKSMIIIYSPLQHHLSHGGVGGKVCVGLLEVRERAHITPSTLGQFWTPHPPCVINIIMALDPQPPLKWWCNMWTEVELLDDFSNMLQIIKICFSNIIRTIFWGVGAVFKNIKPWFMKKFISLLKISNILLYSNSCSMFQLSHPSISKCQH